MSTEDITQARAAFEEACLKEQAAREALEEAQRTLKDAREALDVAKSDADPLILVDALRRLTWEPAFYEPNNRVWLKAYIDDVEQPNDALEIVGLYRTLHVEGYPRWTVMKDEDEDDEPYFTVYTSGNLLEEAKAVGLQVARYFLWDHASSAQEWADEVRAWAEAFGKPKRS